MTPGQHIWHGIMNYPLNGFVTFGWGMFFGYQLHKWLA